MSRPRITAERFYTEPARLDPSKRGDARKADLPPMADLAERLRGGLALADLAAEHHMTVSGLRNRMMRSGWGSDGQKITERPAARCEWCRRKTGGATSCRECATLMAARQPVAYEHGLYGGQWVNRRGVQVWVPTPPPPKKRQPWGKAACGTEGGYYRHLRRTKTEPCARCKKAHVEAEKQRAARRAAA
ncbi:hypothetical protein [Nocardioides sp. YIM 152315]|uniref:hypothetical protein n=1 Tax=Nocardioides sp. YIM 152315 TaxID=3031760 RepID=UPI0023DA5E5D|nr:hypothetical protein [Nocardioides sp. YIM 152315]MDF1603373.1 hypothetical protein [Nocardioides sp. YIM 152315]